MKFKRPFTDQNGNLVRRADDGFTIVKPSSKNRERWWLAKGHHYVVIEAGFIRLGQFASLKESIEVCEAHLHLKPKVFHYFVERARRDFRYSKRLLADPKRFSAACGINQDTALRDAVSTVEQIAERLYQYIKHRSLALSAAGTHIDPAAFRDWEAMIAGNYVQWWRKR